MMILSFVLASLIGVSLGLIGAGGSILTVPVLVYFAGIEPATATAYSLFIVGTTSLFGGCISALEKKVDFKTGLSFIIASFITVFITRKFLLPALPAYWFSLGGFEITKSNGLMLLFAVFMVVAGIAMIRPEKKVDATSVSVNYAVVIISGIAVGILAGLVGAGGGFLIIPALILFAGLDTKIAINTSLLIIAINSLSGFAGDLENGLHPDWHFLLPFSLLALAGIAIGKLIAKKADGTKLKKGFGVFVLVLATIILFEELKPIVTL
ncbi:sulfite exporter TauE/SafE family protein [Danxiaibacter flavus]|uniref:Probable membrane transporter protein n=1 Tax=Danxiaibacter flavus TaxID=3049108 RepID=A0ABV3ZNQ2_9BACT|nr:sulfite exporter TauE/SafE family protein [Chitinophagaceae bacterium DXS]